MNKTILFSALIFSQFYFAQVSLEKNKLVKDGVRYKYSKYEEVFQNNEAKEYFKKSRTNGTVSEVFAYTGGGALGFGLATLITGKKNTITSNGVTYTKEAKKGGLGILLAGVGLIGVGIPFAIAADKNAKKAVELENGEITAFRPYFKVESAENGLALSYNF